MSKNILWNDEGKVGDGLFAKHKFSCKKCGYEVEALRCPKEFCPVCQDEMEQRAALIKEMFRGYQ